MLRPRVITRIRNGVWEEKAIEPADVRRHAREMFGVDLGDQPLLFEQS